MTECSPGCPMCRVMGAAPVPTNGSRVEPGAACKCFPANERCPSEAACALTPGSAANYGLEAPQPKVTEAKPTVGDLLSSDVAICSGHPSYLRLLEELRAVHKTKSGGYGTTTDPFANYSAVAGLSGEPRYLYPVLRSIEKLTRVLSLHAQGRVGELEEEFLDVASLCLCAAAMLREDG